MKIQKCERADVIEGEGGKTQSSFTNNANASFSLHCIYITSCISIALLPIATRLQNFSLEN